MIKIKQFTIKQLFALITTIAIILGIFRRPILYLIENNRLITQFFIPFKHLIWLIGFEINYKDNIQPGDLLGFLMIMIGFAFSVIFHIFLICFIFYIIKKLWNWANDNKSNNQSN